LRAAKALGVALVVSYPVAVYFGLAHLGARSVSLLLLALLLPIALLRARGEKREHLWVVLRVPISVALLLLLAIGFDDRRFVLAMPVLINAVLLAQFALSLRGPMPIVERFARLREKELSDAQVRYCRSVTIVWCVFFVLNGAACAALAVFAPLAWWTLYTGAISYALMGLLFAAEYGVRRARFHR